VVQAGKPRAAAQRQHLHEKPGQPVEVPASERADGAEIRLVQRGDRLEIQPLLAGTRNPAL